MVKERPPWDETCMDIVKIIARRSVCLYHQVACLFLNRNHFVALGYNGPVTGEIHCTDVGCAKDKGKACRGLHAEDNAINHCLIGPQEALKGSTLYISVLPCTQCMKKLQGNQVDRVVFEDVYKRHKRKGERGRKSDNQYQDTLELARAARIRVERYNSKTKKTRRVA